MHSNPDFVQPRQTKRRLEDVLPTECTLLEDKKVPVDEHDILGPLNLPKYEASAEGLLSPAFSEVRDNHAEEFVWRDAPIEKVGDSKLRSDELG